MADVVVLGQVGRDLVLRVRQLPDAGRALPAVERREQVGGKGANQAAALAQLGVPTALVGVVGDDAAGRQARAQAAAEGVDISAVVSRRDATTALLVDLVEDGGRRRLVEDVPRETLLTPADVELAVDQISSCQVLSVQLQQPGDAVRAAVEKVPDTALVVTDGAPGDERTRTAVLRRADVVRADAEEAQLLTGRELGGVDGAREAAAELLTTGARLVALALGAEGNLVAWRAGPAPGLAAEELDVDPRWADGDVVVPLLVSAPVNTTGGGDAYVAALTAALLGGAGPEDAAWVASAAAALTVARLGGRPGLTPAGLRAMVHRHRVG